MIKHLSIMLQKLALNILIFECRPIEWIGLDVSQKQTGWVEKLVYG